MSKRRPKVSLREAVNARRDEVAMVNVMAPLMVMHQRLNDAFFDKLGAVGEHPLSPDARALMRCQLHDVVLSGYQVQPRSTDASRRRGSQLRGLAKRVRALSSEIELVICEENLCESLPPACKVQDWMPFAKSIGLPLVMRAFADEADLRGCAKESPRPRGNRTRTEDRKVLQLLARIYHRIGGRGAISDGGPFARFLAAVWDVLPHDYRCKTGETFVRRAGHMIRNLQTHTRNLERDLTINSPSGGQAIDLPSRNIIALDASRRRLAAPG